MFIYISGIFNIFNLLLYIYWKWFFSASLVYAISSNIIKAHGKIWTLFPCLERFSPSRKRSPLVSGQTNIAKYCNTGSWLKHFANFVMYSRLLQMQYENLYIPLFMACKARICGRYVDMLETITYYFIQTFNRICITEGFVGNWVEKDMMGKLLKNNQWKCFSFVLGINFKCKINSVWTLFVCVPILPQNVKYSLNNISYPITYVQSSRIIGKFTSIVIGLRRKERRRCKFA